MRRGTRGKAGERVEVTLKPEEAERFWALANAGGFPSKAAYARAALLSGHVYQNDQLSALLGELCLAVNGLLSQDRPIPFFEKIHPEIVRFSDAITALEAFLTTVQEVPKCDRT